MGGSGGGKGDGGDGTATGIAGDGEFAAMPLGEALDEAESETEALLFEAMPFELLEGADPVELIGGHAPAPVGDGEGA